MIALLHIWAVRLIMVVCWVSDPEAGCCLCSSICKLVLKVVLNYHWCMPNVLVFLVITLPIFDTHTQHDFPQWYSLLPSIITLYNQEPSTSIWTATLDAAENKGDILWVSLFLVDASGLDIKAS